LNHDLLLLLWLLRRPHLSTDGTLVRLSPIVYLDFISRFAMEIFHAVQNDPFQALVQRRDQVSQLWVILARFLQCDFQSIGSDGGFPDHRLGGNVFVFYKGGQRVAQLAVREFARILTEQDIQRVEELAWAAHV